MKLNFLFVCDKVTSDNKLSVEGIFDSISSDGFPALHPSLNIVLNIEVPPTDWNKEHQETFRISIENETVVERSKPFQPTKNRYQFIHRLQNIPLKKAGKYDIEIFIDGEKLGETYFMAKPL